MSATIVRLDSIDRAVGSLRITTPAGIPGSQLGI